VFRNVLEMYCFPLHHIYDVMVFDLNVFQFIVKHRILGELHTALVIAIRVTGSAPPALASESCSEQVRSGSWLGSELSKSGSTLLDFRSSLQGAKMRSLPMRKRCTSKLASEIQKRAFGFRKLASSELPERFS
jgi:hypothetical protein